MPALFNQRLLPVAKREANAASEPPHPGRRRTSILVEFPDPPLEAIVLQWEFHYRPTVLIQLKRDLREPVQFPGKRPEIPGNLELPPEQGMALQRPLVDFLDPSTGLIFGRSAFEGDLLMSKRAFTLLQPSPDLVLPLESLIECRTEALRALLIPDIQDVPGGFGGPGASA
jgi:hypothetical protein